MLDMKVLFIGNSHTFYNDMPATFADLYEAAEGVRPQVTLLGHPGRRWDWHWQEYYELRFNLMYGAYDYCVIQQAAHPFPGRETTLEYGEKLIALCKECGVTPVVCMTWAEKAHPENQQIMCETYEQLTQEQGALLSPVGRIWKEVLRQAPEVGLYYLDGAHASAYGSYLIALIHYSVITGKSPVGLPAVGRDDLRRYAPEEGRDVCETDPGKTVTALDSQLCGTLQRIAAEELAKN